MSMRIIRIAISNELDVVGARQRAREIAGLCGFAQQDQVRIATSVSELARNVFNYARNGGVEFSIAGADAAQAMQIRIHDEGPGIVNLDLILSGNYRSSTGMGLGILGAKRLMDRCDIVTGAGRGTEIILHKVLPPDAARLNARNVGDLCARLSALASDSMLGEVQQQNQELLGALAELKERQEQLMAVTATLEETNRGILALYAELDEKAQGLRRADQMKSRFLSNMSHEFRTPLSSIRALSKLLLSRADGELTPDQEKQVAFILQGTVALNDMVDDLLDLAKIEAGKVDVRPDTFMLSGMFGALRGMLRPLLVNADLSLVFHEPADDLSLRTDEAKLSQIVRNFVSNAIKYTERGEIAVRAVACTPDTISISVSDSGIGIEEQHLELIFEEFQQVENHLQGRVKGTGLGLPLCRELATLLNGTVCAHSSLGKGSVFTVTVPRVFKQTPA